MMAHRSLSSGLQAITVLVGLALMPPMAAASESERPAALVAEFQDELVQVMREAKSLGVEGRYKRLLPAVSRTFHLPVMVRIATGAHWRNATDSQRDSLVEAFRRMSVTTLAALFDGYNGEAFVAVGTKDGPQQTQLVHTQLVAGNGKRHDISYVAKRFDDGWRLIDVIVDNGISELKVRQSEYHQVLRQGGIDGLIQLLNGKADELIASR